jgi:hypothetical protein
VSRHCKRTLEDFCPRQLPAQGLAIQHPARGNILWLFFVCVRVRRDLSGGEGRGMGGIPHLSLSKETLYKGLI